MDPVLAFLYFGVPAIVGMIGLAAVKLHERSAPHGTEILGRREPYLDTMSVVGRDSVPKSQIREDRDVDVAIAAFYETAIQGRRFGDHGAAKRVLDLALALQRIVANGQSERTRG